MITENTKVEDLRKHKDLKTLFPYFIYNQVGDGAGNFKKDATCLKEIEQKNPTWAAEDMVCANWNKSVHLAVRCYLMCTIPKKCRKVRIRNV